MQNNQHKKNVNRRNLRHNRHVFMLNELEQKALIRFMETYKISNKSKFIRETVIRAILQKFEEDSPTLFD